MFLSCFALFLPYICPFGAEEDENPEMSVCTDQKSPNKSQLSRAKGPGKGQPSKIENVWMAASTLARHQRKNCGIIQTHAWKDWGASPDFHLHEAITSAPQLHCLPAGSWLFIPTSSHEAPSSLPSGIWEAVAWWRLRTLMLTVTRLPPHCGVRRDHVESWNNALPLCQARRVPVEASWGVRTAASALALR